MHYLPPQHDVTDLTCDVPSEAVSPSLVGHQRAMVQIKEEYTGRGCGSDVVGSDDGDDNDSF